MERLRAALERGVAFLPDFLAGLVVLALGVLVAWALRRAMVALAAAAGFDRFLARHRLISVETQHTRTGSRMIGGAVFWVVLLVAFMQTANVWRLEFVAAGLAALIAYLPNILAAVLIFGAAFLAGKWASDRIRESPSTRRPAMLPGAVRAGILTIGSFMALRQLGIAPEILVITFACVFGGIAVATALAFGLGSRRAVERMTQDWYENERARPPIVQTPAEATRAERPPAEPRAPGMH